MRLAVARVGQRDVERLHRRWRLKPRSTDSNRSKLRASRPAPTSNTTASVVSATISRLRRRWRFGSLVVLPPSSRMRVTTSPIELACHAGIVPKITDASTATPKANPTTTIVEARLIQQRHADRRIERGDRGRRPVREHQASRAAGQTEHQALDQQRAHQRGASGADGDAHRQLAAAAERPDQHQAGDVDADDQQHQADGAQQHEHRLANVADHRLAQRMDRGRVVAIGARKLRRQPARRSRACPREPARSSTLGFQPADHVDVMRAALRFEIPARRTAAAPTFRIAAGTGIRPASRR